jgi:hypothetical protein
MAAHDEAGSSGSDALARLLTNRGALTSVLRQMDTQTLASAACVCTATRAAAAGAWKAVCLRDWPHTAAALARPGAGVGAARALALAHAHAAALHAERLRLTRWVDPLDFSTVSASLHVRAANGELLFCATAPVVLARTAADTSRWVHIKPGMRNTLQPAPRLSVRAAERDALSVSLFLQRARRGRREVACLTLNKPCGDGTRGSGASGVIPIAVRAPGSSGVEEDLYYNGPAEDDPITGFTLTRFSHHLGLIRIATTSDDGEHSSDSFYLDATVIFRFEADPAQPPLCMMDLNVTGGMDAAAAAGGPPPRLFFAGADVHLVTGTNDGPNWAPEFEDFDEDYDEDGRGGHVAGSMKDVELDAYLRSEEHLDWVPTRA